MNRKSLLSLVLVSVGQFVLAGDSGVDVATKFKPIAPCSTLIAAAKARQIPIETIEPVGQGDKLTPGDSVTALLTLFEKGGRRTQWLLFLQAVEDDRTQQPPKERGPMMLYSSRGNKLEFSSSFAFGSLRTLGPFAELEGNRKQPKLKDETDRFVLDQGYLALGFDQAAATMLRIREAKGKEAFNFRPTPFSEAEISRGRALGEKVQLTDSEERALGAGVPALITYFGLLSHAEGLEDIAMKVVARPSIWSIVRHVGVTAGIFFRPEKIEKGTSEGLALAAASAANGGTSGQVYHIPMEMQLNEQPALYVTLFVTTPRPPLLLCGGVVGLLAEKPGEKETYLTLRVISAKANKK